jgi:hypothetical protein
MRISLVKIDVIRETVLLSGDSLVNEALQAGLVKRRIANFKRLALAPSRTIPETFTGLISRGVRT